MSNRGSSVILNLLNGNLTDAIAGARGVSDLQLMRTYKQFVQGASDSAAAKAVDYLRGRIGFQVYSDAEYADRSRQSAESDRVQGIHN